MKPLAIDLFCGLGGWTEGLLAEGYNVIGFDIERHEYGEAKYPAQLVLQDVLTLDGARFKDAALIVASPPCQAYSYRAMPWKRAKALPPPDNSLFEACFRIQREAIAAAGGALHPARRRECARRAEVGRSQPLELRELSPVGRRAGADADRPAACEGRRPRLERVQERRPELQGAGVQYDQAHQRDRRWHQAAGPFRTGVVRQGRSELQQQQQQQETRRGRDRQDPAPPVALHRRGLPARGNMNQTRIGSLIEACVNVAIGLCVSVVANQLVFPRFGFHPSLGENVLISLICTAISIARQYVLRRWFNARLHAVAQRLGSRLA